MKLFEKIKQNREKNKGNNKGFSLVELIIVIAIMAILVGIVGTQVIPYLNKSKEAKDFQIINSYSTAAMTAYTSNSEDYTTGTTTDIVIYPTTANTGTALDFENEVKALTGYDTEAILRGKMSSTEGKKVKAVKITINLTTGVNTITTQAYEDAACTAGNEIFDEVVSQL